MAGGEKAKKSGESGEEIIEELLKLIGWTTMKKGLDFGCLDSDKHKHVGSQERKTHGVDFLNQYKCPLTNCTQQNILVSVKNRKKYPNSPNSDFKEYLKDISFAMECFPRSEYHKFKVSADIKRKEITGLIFWITSDEDNSDNGVIDKISDFRNTDGLSYNVVYLVDNVRANFIFNSVKFVQSLYPNSTIEFFYPDTGYNMESYTKSYSGRVLPVQYINSSIIPFKIKDESNNNVLILTHIDNFEEDYLKRLIGLAQNLTLNWPSKVILGFPDYIVSKHEESVISAKSQFDDRDFIEKVFIKCFMPNIKSLQED